jgi:acetolactate synthase-1/2/3 large subunit
MQVSGGDLVIQSLLNHGVDTLFALPGIQLDHLFNAIHDASGRMQVLAPRHEQAAAYMAFGYAQASGQIGCFAAVPGPGFLNTAAALATAQACGAPILALIGQIDSRWIGHSQGELHEIEDQLGILERLTKFASRVTSAAEIPLAVADCIARIRTGRPAPVGLEVPPNVLMGRSSDGPHSTVRAPHIDLDPDAVKRAVDRLANARSPLILIGGGALDVAPAVKQLAERLQAPVLANRHGRGVLDDRHPLSLVQPIGNELLRTADVILAIGSRLSYQRLNGAPVDGQVIIQIDRDVAHPRWFHAPHVCLVADSRTALPALIDGLDHQGARPASRLDITRELKHRSHEIWRQELQPQMELLSAVREALPGNGILVDELTQVGYVARAAFPVYEPRHLLTSGYQGTLGFGYATALGAQAACPDVAVVSISGDGGFLYNASELATAAKYKLPVIAVVFNDGCFGNVRRMQQQDHGGRVIATDLVNPDFVRLAESYGLMGQRATGAAALKGAIEDAIRRGGPALIEVPVGAFPDPWPWISVRRSQSPHLG